MGKDILTTHAVYWPTLLMGVGLPVPNGILAHGWWVVGDTKMSKSLGNVIDPLALRERFGTDAVRWYLLREMPTGSDASYTPERFLTRYEELANVLGNLASRVVAMIDKYRAGVVPEASGQGLDRAIEDALAAAREAMAAFRVHDALAASMELARIANGWIEERQPWALAKVEAKAEAGDPASTNALDETLATLARVLTVLAALFQPVAPAKMAELASSLGLDGIPTLEDARRVALSGRRVSKGAPLFPKVDPGVFEGL
jgi:methionyl-tRNA synthetase